MGKVRYDRNKTRKTVVDYALKQLRKIANQRFTMANHRISRLVNSGYSEISPAYQALSEPKHFSSSGKDYKQLSKEVARCNAFLNLETSSITGTKKFDKYLVSKTGYGLRDKQQISSIFDILHRVQEIFPSDIYGSMVGSKPTLEMIRKEIENRADLDADRMGFNEAQQESVLNSVIESMMDAIDKLYSEFQSFGNDLEKNFNRIW